MKLINSGNNLKRRMKNNFKLRFNFFTNYAKHVVAPIRLDWRIVCPYKGHI